MAPQLTVLLPYIGNTLTQNADRYVRTVVNYTDDAGDPVDSDGKKHNYFKLSGIWHCMVKNYGWQFILSLYSVYLPELKSVLE